MKTENCQISFSKVINLNIFSFFHISHHALLEKDTDTCVELRLRLGVQDQHQSAALEHYLEREGQDLAQGPSKNRATLHNMGFEPATSFSQTQWPNVPYQSLREIIMIL